MTPVDITDFLHELARLSGEAILPFFRTGGHVADKREGGRFDPVTEADRAAELIIRNRIREAFPLHGVVGEEFGEVEARSEFCWIIDPIDGTRAFICGLPTWGTLIGLMRQGRPIFGLMHQPFTRETFIGDGAKAHWQGPSGTRRLAVRACEALSDAYMMTTTPELFQGEEIDRYRSIERDVKMVRYGADCYAYVMLAMGQIDLVVEAGLKPVDIAPLVPIIEGAGGVVTDWEGGPAAAGGRVVAAGDRRLHAAALHRLRS